MVDVIDYADVLATAIEAIAESGRVVTFRRNKRTVNPSDPMGAPIGSASSLPNIMATFVYPTGLSRLGGVVKKRKEIRESQQVALVAGVTGEALEDYDEVLDTDGSLWIIDAVDILKPGSTTLLYYVGVSRL